jgi:uncharacterized protein (DUF433 family)
VPDSRLNLTCSIAVNGARPDLADGWSEAEVIANYPGVAHEDILACLAYARDVLSSEKVFQSAAE